MSSHDKRLSDERNIVAFPQLNRAKNSTDSLSQFSLGSKASGQTEQEDSANPRLHNIHSIESVATQTLPPETRPEEQPFDPDDASAGTWGSDSSDYTSSLDDEDENFSLGFNGEQVPQNSNTSETPWPIFAGVPPAPESVHKRTNSSVNGDDGIMASPTKSKLGQSVRPVTSSQFRAKGVDGSKPESIRGNYDKKDVVITTQPLSGGPVIPDAIFDAQKRFFAAIGGPSGLGDLLGADIPKFSKVRGSLTTASLLDASYFCLTFCFTSQEKVKTGTAEDDDDEADDSIHGIDPDSVYKRKQKKDGDKGFQISVPTKNADSTDGNGGKESLDTLYFSADEGLDPFEQDKESKPKKASNELGSTNHAIVSRRDIEVDSSFEGSCSFGDEDTDAEGESSALHVEFSPARSFLHQSTDTLDFHDDPHRSAFQSNPEIQGLAQSFAMEHRIFLRAILELLGKRDKYATEVGMNDPHTIKSGPLKKASHLIKGIWKVKYVEIRRGMFSYYEDALSNTSNHQGELLRKNIPLEANSCTCRAVKLHHKALNLAPGGAIFELTVNEGPKRLWMANSREERGAWINAIHDAMVGGSVARGDPRGKTNGSNSKNAFYHDVKKYMKTHNLIKHAKNKTEYVRALRELLGLSLYIPVHWLMEQVESEHTGFHEEAISSGVDQLWKDLIRDSVRINGELFVGKSAHAPERIVGTLMRSIMSCNRKAVAESKISSAAASKYHLTESQALAYARDVLLSGNRTRSGGDSYYCVDTLCSSPGLVVTVPNSSQAEPVSVTVSMQVDDLSTFYSVHDKSGWLRTRTRWAQRWKKRYFVLSEGTLSFYEKAFPRPHGLQGQIVLVDATIFVKKDDENVNGVRKKRFIVTIVAKDGLTLKERERQLLFENEEKFVVWSSTLESALKHKLGDDSNPSPNAVKSVLRRLGHGRDDGQSFYGYSLSEKSLRDHAPSLGLDSEAIERLLAMYARTSCATVKVSVEASTEYKICTTDPQGDEREDTWA